MAFDFSVGALKQKLGRRFRPHPPLAVCVCGMHRSGTSMVAQTLSRCGVYMGPLEVLTVSAPDNQDGFWEDSEFVAVNDEILRLFSGSWDRPPQLEKGWENAAELLELRRRARRVIRRHNAHRAWGWKDPRSSITIPFWSSLMPGLKVVICLRHPWEVAQSLRRRNDMPIPTGLALWKEYQERALSGSNPTNRVITHYESHFVDPQAELRRLLAFLGLPSSPAVLAEATTTFKDRLRTNRYGAGSETPAIPPPIAELYRAMRAEASAATPDPADLV